VDNDLEILAAPALETQFETLVRVSQTIAAHGDPKELFGVLVNEAAPRLVQFGFIGMSFRGKDSDTFQNYFIDMASRSELARDEKLTPEETLTLWVYERQEPLLRSTYDEMEPCCRRLQAIFQKTLHSLNLRSTIGDGAAQTGCNHFR
jgi:hypothetical protein